VFGSSFGLLGSAGARRRAVPVALVLVAAVAPALGPIRPAAAAPGHLVSSVWFPRPGDELPAGVELTVSGGASNGETGVSSVDISVDGGATWHRATPVRSAEEWTYTFTPTGPGMLTIATRATTGTVQETPPASTTIKLVPAVAAQPCPCPVRWPDRGAGLGPNEDPDPQAVELGLKFQTDRPGVITGVAFRRYPANVGPFLAHLWTADGDMLAEATMNTSDGFPYLRFATPVPVDADQTYVASYYTPSGHYASTDAFFTDTDPALDAAPFRIFALPDGPAGVYHYGVGGGFPTDTWNQGSYWVEPIFDTV